MRYNHIFISTIIWLTSCKQAVVTERHANGKPKEERTYLNSDSSNFKIVQYYPSGQVSFEGNVVNRLFVGEKVSYYENGKVKQVDSLHKPCALDFCCCDGLVKRYRENGSLSEIFINRNGVENGPVYTYDSAGRMETKYEMTDGRKNGEAEKYFENGVLAFKAKFQHDTIQGYAIYFDVNRDTLKMMRYNGQNMDFPYYKWLRNGQVLKGEVADDGKHIHWSWMDKNRNILRRKVEELATEVVVPEED